MLSLSKPSLASDDELAVFEPDGVACAAAFRRKLEQSARLPSDTNAGKLKRPPTAPDCATARGGLLKNVDERTGGSACRDSSFEKPDCKSRGEASLLSESQPDGDASKGRALCAAAPLSG